MVYKAARRGRYLSVIYVTVREEHADRAVVEVVSAAGRARVDLVKLAGRWHIDLPQYGAP